VAPASPSADVSEPTPVPASRRDRAIRLTVRASIAAKVFSITCTFAQVPIALRYLGTEAYGFWMTITSVVLVLNTIDFGVGVGMQHAMATAFGRDEPMAIRRLFWTGTAVLAVLGLAVLGLGLAVIHSFDWAGLLKIGDPTLRSETRLVLTIALVTFVACLPFNAVNRLAAAVQRGWVNSGWVAAGNGVSFALVAAAAFGHWGFSLFLFASLLVPAVQGLGLLVHLCLILGWTIVPTRLAPWDETQALLKASLWFALPQAGQALVQAVPAVAISLAAGPDSVTAYNLLMRLFGLLQQGQVLLLTPVWPAYTEASVRGDQAWIRRAYRQSALILAGLALAVGLVGWKSHLLLTIWVGHSANLVSGRLAALAGIWCVLQMAAQPPSYYLMGTGRLRQLAWAATPGLFITAGALFWGARGQTALAVLAAGSTALAALLLPPVFATAWASLRSPRPLTAAA